MSSSILLVEDEENVGLTLKEKLSQEGYDTTLKRNSSDAFFEVQKHRFDMAILDIGIPGGGSGFDVARLIQSIAPHTAIVFLTAYGSYDDRIRGLELGAEDYIVKPFHLKELLLRVRNRFRKSVLNSFEGAYFNEIVIGRAKINLVRFQVEREGSVYSLSYKEVTILKLLLKRRGCVVSRDEILDCAWPEGEYPSPRTIDNFIMRLRRLIENFPEHPKVIKNIRGVGYQLL